MSARDTNRNGSRNAGNTPTVSACMIVRDEERLLPGCLESICDWVDEIIVVDTGSTDRTVEVARRYDVRVFEIEWNDDFSAARNYSLEQATGDWIFVIDADERFVSDDLDYVRKAVARDEFSVLAIDVYNEYPGADSRQTYSNSIRFFKRDLGLRYQGIVHNALAVPEDTPVLRVPARLRHLGYGLSEEEMHRKFARTRRLLERQLANDPDDPFALFNLAELLRGANPEVSEEHAAEIERTAGRVLELVPPDDPRRGHLHLMCLSQMAATFLSRREFARAGEYCRRALEIRHDYLDGLIQLGLASFGEGNVRESIGAFEKYLEAQKYYRTDRETNPIILSYPVSRDLAHNNLGHLYSLLGDTRKARLHYLAALETNPRYRRTALALGRLFLAEGDREQAGRFFRHQIEYSGPNLECYVSLAALARIEGCEGEAKDHLDQAEADFPGAKETRLELGRLLLQQGCDDEAIGTLTEVLSESGSSESIEPDLGDICFEIGRFDLATGYYRTALEKRGDDYDLLNNLGNCFFRSGDWTEAEKHYRRAQEIDSNAAPAHRNLGLTLIRQNRYEAARESLEEYLRREPDDYPVHQLAGDLARGLGDYASAIIHYECVLSGSGLDQAVLLGLSESYLLAGHRDAALKGFRHLLEVNPDLKHAQTRVKELTQSAPQV